MNNEIGKWFLDVAKYVMTAFLLTKMFRKVDSWSVIIGAFLTVFIMFAIGVYFLNKNKK